jgi:hypothetical protein
LTSNADIQRVANSLLKLILTRITPSVLSEESRMDEVLEILIRLFDSIRKVQKYGTPRENNPMSNDAEPVTSAQQRLIQYFRLCGRLRLPGRVVDSYNEAKMRGVQFTPTMYSFAITGVSRHPGYFAEFSNKVLGDMAADGYEFDVHLTKQLLQGAATLRNLPAAVLRFRALEQAYFPQI